MPELKAILSPVKDIISQFDGGWYMPTIFSGLGSCIIPMVILSLGAMLTNCAYRFTNDALQPPTGIRTLAVEAVYDTSQEVLPHELLWESLQRAFAKNGRLILTPQTKADALLRAHITSAQIAPSGTVSRSEVFKDPKVSIDEKPPIEKFKKLTRAGSWTTQESIIFTVKIEVWDLKTRKLLHSADYTTSGEFRSHRSSEIAQNNTHYLLFEESLNSRFRQLAKAMSEKIVADFLL